MTVLITGARGFIGRFLSRYLAGAHRKVVGLGHGAWPEADYSRWGLHDWLDGDVSPVNLDEVLARHGRPTAVIHLAGGSAVGPSIEAPARDFHRTVSSTSAIAEWTRHCAPNAPLVMASSAAVYGAGHNGRIPEVAFCTPFSPYGFHKRMAELVLESYAQSFGLRAASVRLFSVYGPSLRKQLLWDVCTKLATEPARLTLSGHGGELRDWLHVEDAARLLATALDHADVDCPIVNSGTGIATPVRAITQRLIDCWRSAAEVAFSGTARTGDPQSLVADNALARSWGWAPARDWETGLYEYVAWYKETNGLAQ